MGIISMESSRLLRASVMALLELGINWQAASTRWGSEPLRLEISSSCGGTCFPPSAVVWCCCGARKTPGAQSPLEHWPGLCWLPTVPLAMAGSAMMGVHPVGPHQGCWHPSNSLQGPAVLQDIPIPGGAQPAAPSVPWPQVTPAISSIMEKVTICHCHHGSTSSVLSLIIYLKGRAGSQVALGSSREGLCSVPSSQVGCGAP